MSASQSASGLSRPLHENGCLFCLRVGARFTSREHVYPESLGNRDLVLPRGVVCDQCNNGPLARVDDALVNLPPIRCLRVVNGIPTKDGSRIAASFDGRTYLESLEPGNLRVTSNSERAMMLRPGGFELQMRTSAPIHAARWSMVARALYKIGLECIYLDQGVQGAFDPMFDDLRLVVLGRQKSGGCLYISKKMGEPTNACSALAMPMLADGRNALFVHLDVFGLELATEALIRSNTLPPPAEELRQYMNVLTWSEIEAA